LSSVGTRKTELVTSRSQTNRDIFTSFKLLYIPRMGASTKPMGNKSLIKCQSTLSG